MTGYRTSNKGSAFLAAISCGFISTNPSKEEFERFEAFWEAFSKSTFYQIDDAGEVLNDRPKHQKEKVKKYLAYGAKALGLLFLGMLVKYFVSL